MELRKRYGLELDRPNLANGGEFTDREVVTEFIKPLLRKMVANPIPWDGLQSGNVTVYILRRSDKMVETALHRFHVVIWHGMESYCIDLTEDDARAYIG